MSTDKAIVLPSAEEIWQRLTKIMNDDWSREIYTKIAEYGGTKKDAEGIVLMFTLAIYGRVHGGLIANTMHMMVPVWIDALVEDKEVAEKAKAIHASAMDASRKNSGNQVEVSLNPPIKDERQALAYLKQWIRDHGYEGEIQVSASYGKRGNYYDFDVLKPYGVFLVFEDGKVDDNYEALVKKKNN